VSGSVEKKRVLVIGKDARTDAIAEKCLASSPEPEVYALTEFPIPGLIEKCTKVFMKPLTDRQALIPIVQEVCPHLAIIGPEEPLEVGFVDALNDLGVPAFGPTRRLAAIEYSKSWTRELLDRYDIPGNPDYRIFTSKKGLGQYLEKLQSFVIKPDGLTGGKGVRVSGEHLHSRQDALSYAESLLALDGRVQVEERLDGEEFSLQTITDGNVKIHCPLVQDHKRAFKGDGGPNTGGMGSYSCPDFSLPFLEADDLKKAQRINEQVIEALCRELGEPYRGVLYGGFMAVADGIRLIEYNARFGDPEALNVLPLLQTDFVELCWAVATGTLKPIARPFDKKATVCKYIVPRQYPQAAPRDEKIVVPNKYRRRDDVKWYWAASEKRNGDAYLTSSRSGAFVGIAESIEEAELIAEAAAQSVEGLVRDRDDIGRKDVIELRVRHMESLRGRGTRFRRTPAEAGVFSLSEGSASMRR